MTYGNEYIFQTLKQMCSKSTQKDVARKLGFSPQYISDVLRGRRDITAELARAMGYERGIHYEKIK